MDNQYLRLPNNDIFTQKNIPRPSSFNLKCRKLLNYYPETSKFANRASSGFYSTKNIFSSKSNIFSSSNNFNIFNLKTQTPKIKKISRIKPQSAYYKKIFREPPNILSKSMYSNSCLEKEKLYQETYQIKKLIKNLQYQLNKITKENRKKERQLSAKDDEINKIIIKNKDLNNEDEEVKNNYYNYISNNSNINEIKLIKQNTAVNMLISKIKREIKLILNETQKENDKLDEMKKMLFISKSKELSIESNLYSEQIKKIKVLIENSIEIKEQNDNKIEEFASLQENIERQNLIIDNLTRENIFLENKQDNLNAKLELLQNDLRAKIEQAKKNDSELNLLSLKNKNLSKDKLIQKQLNSINEDIFPLSLKSLYSDKVSTLKKNINFYKKQIKYSEEMLNKLKEQKKKLIDSNQNLQQKIKIDPNFMGRVPTSVKSHKRPQSSISIPKENKLEEKDFILKLRKDYKKLREEELSLEKKANIYYNKLKEINISLFEEKEKKSEMEEKKSENQLEFGIDETNPYYTDNEENIPESNIKFTAQQFNQFTYILFKNFEAKYITSNEAANKIINPFLSIIKKNNYEKISYPSSEFDDIIEHLTKIILNVLNSDNEYNHTLTKIFIGALLYNSDCDLNKLVEYFTILFSYTKNYKEDEKKYIEKLKTKYKNETKKLVECITSYILNDLTSSQYFSLFKMKDLLDNNQINLKDKYIEFLFYFLKKFDDSEAKLEDLKYSLFNEIVPLGDTTVHSKAFVNKNEEEENDNVDMDKIEDLLNNEKNEINNDENINKEENKEFDYDMDKYKENDINIRTNKTEPNREENISKKKQKKDQIIKDNSNILKKKFKQESKKNCDIIDNINDINNINDNSNINKKSGIKKNLNADLFDDIDNVEKNNIDNNNIDCNINNEAKINGNEHEDIKNNVDNNDSDYVEENMKNIDVNNSKNDKDSKDKNINDIINPENQEINQKKEEELSNKNENENDKEREKEKEKDKDKENDNINNISTEKLIHNQRVNTEEEKKSQSQNKKIEIEKEDEKSSKQNEKNISHNSNKNNKIETEKNKFNESENENESVTEITNEDFIKHIKDSLNLIQTALDENSLDFINFIEDNVRKIKLDGKLYDYINIEDLNDKLIGIKVVLSDMQLSCLCSKYSLPDELRLIDVKNFEKSLRDFKNGNLKLL